MAATTTNPLAMISRPWRAGIYMGLFLAGVTLGALHILGIDQVAQIDLTRWDQVVAYLGTIFGPALAASNLTPKQDNVADGGDA